MRQPKVGEYLYVYYGHNHSTTVMGEYDRSAAQNASLFFKVKVTEINLKVLKALETDDDDQVAIPKFNAKLVRVLRNHGFDISNNWWGQQHPEYHLLIPDHEYGGQHEFHPPIDLHAETLGEVLEWLETKCGSDTGTIKCYIHECRKIYAELCEAFGETPKVFDDLNYPLPGVLKLCR